MLLGGVLGVFSIVSNAQRHGRGLEQMRTPNSSSSSEARLVAVGSGWSKFLTLLEPVDEVTVVALTLRNQSLNTVELRSVEPIKVVNAEVLEIHAIGPQNPSLTYQFLEGDPPRYPPGLGPDVALSVARVNGFVVQGARESKPPYVEEGRNDRERTGSRQLVADQPNDVSIVVSYRRLSDVTVSYIEGFRIHYQVAESDDRLSELVVSDVRNGTCLIGGDSFGSECQQA